MWQGRESNPKAWGYEPQPANRATLLSINIIQQKGFIFIILSGIMGIFSDIVILYRYIVAVYTHLVDMGHLLTFSIVDTN